jgi:hypothetical protein
MGVKSTIELTEKQAIDLYVELKMNTRGYKNKLKSEALLMSLNDLEDELMRLDDENCGGESFNNYLII